MTVQRGGDFTEFGEHYSLITDSGVQGEDSFVRETFGYCPS